MSNRKSRFPWPLILLAVVAAAVPFLWIKPAKDLIAWRTDVAAATVEAKSAGKPVMLYFTADWCGPCRVMKRGVFSLESVKQVMESRVVPVKVDMTDRRGPGNAVAAQFDVQGIPAFILLDATGAAKKSAAGGMSESQLIEWLNQATP